MEQQKDYDLLRPFDLEAAKRGEPLVWKDGQSCIKEYLGGPDKFNLIAAYTIDGQIGIWETKCLRMAPLAWVEGRPVYTGDVLYSKFFHGMKECIDGTFEVTGFEDGQFRAGKLSDIHATKISSCSWSPPKVKREVKVLAYLTGENLVWKRCGVEAPDFYIRVPSEDKVIEIEEPAGPEK